MSAVADTYVETPLVFDILTKCMSLQPDFDPEAGYGVFQIPTLFLNLEFSNEDMTTLVEKVSRDPVRLYVLIRCRYMGIVDKEELEAFVHNKRRYDYKMLYRKLTAFVPSMKKPGVSKRLSEPSEEATLR